MIALVGSLAHAFSSSCVTKAVSPFAHLAESASCRRGNVSLDLRRSYKYLLPSSLWSKQNFERSWVEGKMGQMVDSGNISFPFSLSSTFLTWHWNSWIMGSKRIKIVQNQVFETGTWPSDAEKNLITSNDHLLKMDTYWQKNGDTASCAFLKLKASGELRSDQANVGRYQKLGKVVGIFQIIMRKLIKCCIQFGLARQNKEISKDLQGIFEISLKQCIVKHCPPRRKSFEYQPCSTLLRLLMFVKLIPTNGIDMFV